MYPALSTLLIASLCFWLSPLLALPLSAQPTNSPTVQIGNGVVFKGNLSTNVESFFNIKFGQDTSGKGRFAAPWPFVYPEDTVVNASVYGAACPQQKVPIPSIPILGNVTNISEDCLTLRVDRPANTTATDKLPVMVYLYGGGFVVGQTYDRAYDPVGLISSSVQKNMPVIYVSINYRVGIFGFAASSAIQAERSLNAGLLDQRLGLEWIKENIHFFGGDQDSVTLFGESAGGFSVGLHITAYGGTQDPLFHHAIMESGSTTSVAGIAGGIATNHTASVATLANCTSTNQNATQELDCLRNLPLATLLSVVIPYEYAIAPPLGLVSFLPTSGSAFLPDAPSKLLSQGKFHKNINLIAGWNQNDGSIFATSALNYTTDRQLTKFFQVAYPGLTSNTTTQLLALYPLSGFTPYTSPNATAQYFRLAQIERDQQFTCPAIHLAQSMANHSSPDTSVYLYQLDSSLFTAALAAAGEGYLGISHASDIPFVFNEASAFGASTQDVALASQMSGTWARFANTGSVGSSNGSAIVQGWQRATGGNTSSTDLRIMVLGGPDPGMAIYNDTTRSGGILADQDLIRRCAFWNSEEVLNELAV